MSFTIRFTLSNDNPVQPTSILDYGVLSIIIATSGLFSIIILLLLIRRKYGPLRAKNVPKLIFSLIFGTIHIWGTFVAHDHFKKTRELQMNSCVLWNFWIQYFLGFNIWYVIFIMRQEDYIWVFWGSTHNISKKQNMYIQIAMCLLLITPLAIIFGMITVFNGIQWNASSDRCETVTEWKFIILGWIIFCVIFMIILNFINKYEITQRFYTEYTAINSIVKLSIAIILINGIITLFGLIPYVFGRAIATLLIVYLHNYTFYCISGKEFWYAITFNSKYEEKYKKSILLNLASAHDIKSLLKIEEAKSDFLEYVKIKDPIIKSGSNILGREPTVINPSLYVECYNKMLTWKKDHDVNDPKMNIQELELIFGKYMNSKSKLYINIPNTFIIYFYHQGKESRIEQENEFSTYKHANPPIGIFDEVIDWIPLELGKYWGNAYLKSDMYNRPFFSILITTLLNMESSSESMDRLREMKLLDLYGIVTMPPEDDDIELLKYNTPLIRDPDFMPLEKFTRIDDI
jgi:hypothetical protein